MLGCEEVNRFLPDSS